MDLPAQNAAEAILALGGLMHKAGLVHASYPQAVADREMQHPTGLPDHVMAAIPHCSGEHVVKSSIAIARLQNPVTFYNIADPEEPLEIRLMFMLAIKDPADQLDTLRALTNTFQREDVMERMRDACDKKELIEALESAGWESNEASDVFVGE